MEYRAPAEVPPPQVLPVSRVEEARVRPGKRSPGPSRQEKPGSVPAREARVRPGKRSPGPSRQEKPGSVPAREARVRPGKCLCPGLSREQAMYSLCPRGLPPL